VFDHALKHLAEGWWGGAAGAWWRGEPQPRAWL